MVDKEKVLKGLECCSKSISKACPMECPYRVECLMQDDKLYMYSVMHDALELMKEPPQWISVKDRLPGIGEDVLILFESKVSRKIGYAITCLKDSFYFGSTPIPYQTPQWNEPWQYFRENNVITHWMPLPEPPEESHHETTKR